MSLVIVRGTRPGLAHELAGWWRQYRRHTAGRLALGVVVFAGAVAVLAPLLPLADPTAFGPNAYGAPSPVNLMGTDNLGRDVLSRVAFGARTAILVALGSAGI